MKLADVNGFQSVHEETAKVKVHNVVKKFGEVTAVNGMSLEVRQGEFFTLLGASGCGKTTTLMMIAGFEVPSSGSVWLDGKDVTGLEPQKRNIGMVFQSYALFPHLSIASNIGFPLKARRFPRGEIDRRVQEVLKLVRLEGFERRRPNQLSGGQQQRVGLARALVYNPTLLLMDEPLGSLDKQLRTEMQKEIRQLKETTKATVVYVTHDQEEALSMSDRIGVMAEGRLCQMGTPDELFDHPQSRLVASTLGEVCVLLVEIISYDKDNGTAAVRLGGETVIDVACAKAPPAADIRKAWICVRPLHVRIRPLNDGLVRAVVEQIAYLGGEFKVYLKLQDMEAQMKAIVPSGSVTPHVGDSVGLWFDPGRCTLVFD